MSVIYDNWERLVAAVLKRELLRELSYAPSMSSSISSRSSSFLSPLLGSPFMYSHFDPPFFPEAYCWGHNSGSGTTPDETQTELIPAEVIVNGEPLDWTKLRLLQSCAYPPKNLTRGCYWYDKYAGFWGKLGKKPSQIISANLDIGGRLKPDSSNGTTLVYINGRVITKVELRMLQLIGVKSYPGCLFWMYEDGSYEEVPNMFRPSIWRKVGVKLICSLLSLPFPPKSYFSSESASTGISLDEKDPYKLLLIGCNESGTSTIFKQALYRQKDVPFSKDELQRIKTLIQSNLYSYIATLLESHKLFEEGSLTSLSDELSDDETSMYSLPPRFKAFCDWILHFRESSGLSFYPPSMILQTASLVDELWNHPVFQEIYKRRKELQSLSSTADFFLERALDVLKPDYVLSEFDILCAQEFLPSLTYIDFWFPLGYSGEQDVDYFQDFSTRYQLIRCAPIETWPSFKMFSDARIIIYCVSLSDYDQFAIDGNGAAINKMMHAKQVFERVCTDPTFYQKQFILLLTKYDVFEEKIMTSPLKQCEWFDDFDPVDPNHRLGKKGFHYIAVKFKRLYEDLTGVKLFVSSVNCFDGYSVDLALKYVYEVVKWKEEEEDLLLYEAVDVISPDEIWPVDYYSQLLNSDPTITITSSSNLYI